MEEGSFDIDMLDISVKDSGNVEEAAEGLKMSGGSHCLVIVNPIVLGKALSYIMDFVVGNVAGIVPFPFADQLPFKGSLAMGEFRLWHQYEDVQVH